MSSSACESRFADFLTASFALLRREHPDLYATCCDCLAPRSVSLRVDGDTVSMRFLRGRADFVPPPAVADIGVETSRSTILAVIDAELTLLDAILTDQLLLRGNTNDLLAFHDGLAAYVHGAVRAPSFPRLLGEFRQNSLFHGGLSHVAHKIAPAR